MNIKTNLFQLFLLALISCTNEDLTKPKLTDLWGTAPSINGSEAYLSSPMLTAGNRVYMVGHQDGSFPELGWHIQGEMGGIWNHPIKLMDGFEASFTMSDGRQFPLEKATTFTNYPFYNVHIYEFPSIQLQLL